MSDPRTRFSDRAGDYVRYRPSYAPPAIDAILDGLGDPSTLVAADVGAGTGISARLLAGRGIRVHAIEPNEAMRSAAEAHELVAWSAGTAEDTGLGDASVDLVLCAQAFHWFRRDEALREFARILRPRGRLALMWNDRDRSDPFSDAYYETVLSTPEGRRVVAGWGRDDPFAGASGWRAIPEQSWTHPQDLDRDGVLGRALSASYVPKSGPEHERIVAALEDLCRTHADPRGMVTLRYRTRLYLGEKAG